MFCSFVISVVCAARVRYKMFEKTKLGRWSRYVFVELADPRTNHWPLIRSPLPVLIIVILWIYFVLSWGPKFMANRKPFKIQKLMIVYNAIQVVISLALVYPGLSCYVLGTYSLTCEPIDNSRSPVAMRVSLNILSTTIRTSEKHCLIN